MSTQTQSHKFASTILQNLPEVPEDIMQGWIENPKALQKLLSGLVSSVNGIATEFKVFRTIKLGTGPTNADGFRCHLKDNKMKVSNWANDILGKPAFSVATKETELDLVVVSVVELGFKNRATLKDIYDAAKKRGLELCPNEVGPQLRLQYRDQPKDEWLIIGMEPITDSDGYLHVFSVVRNDRDLWLDAYYFSPDYFWDEVYRFVFVLPRK